jgi:sec-independent protein translocase protein TatA
MFNLGWPEIIIVAIAVLLIFGPKKIPELGSALGKTLKGFKAEMGDRSSDKGDSDLDR